MTEKSGGRKQEGLSWRWKIAAVAGLTAALGALWWGGFWAGAAVMFVVFSILAFGKPFRRYQDFMYRGVCPAGAIALTTSWLLDTVLLVLRVPDPVRRLFVAFAIGAPIGILPVLLMREWVIGFQVDWVSAAIPDLNRKDVLAFLRSLYFALNYPVMVVDGPLARTTLQGGPSGPAGLLQKIGGPGLLFVQHGYAVVLEWGGKFRRVAKAGATTLEMWERPKAVVDLGPQRRTLPVEGIYTSDGVTFDCEIGVIYQIRRSPAASAAPRSRKPQASPVPRDAAAESPTEAVPAETFGRIDPRDLAASSGTSASPETKDRFPVGDSDLLKAVYAVDNWQEAVEALAGYVLREVVLQYRVNELYKINIDSHLPELRGPAVEEIFKKLNKAAEQWGVEISRVDIGTMRVPAEVRRQLLRKWVMEEAGEIRKIQSEADFQVMTKRGKAEAEVVLGVEQVKSQVRAELVRQLRDEILDPQLALPELLAQRLLGVVESLSRGLVAEDVTRLREVDVMERVVDSGGNKTFVFGSAGQLLLNTGSNGHTTGDHG